MMEGGRDYFNNNDEEHKGREVKLCAGSVSGGTVLMPLTYRRSDGYLLHVTFK